MAGGNFGGGSGTQADPFLIEDWADLETIQTATTDYYYKVTADLDANDRNDGVWTAVDFKKFLEIDFDGHKIRNISSAASTALFAVSAPAFGGTNDNTIKSFVMENIYSPNASIFSLKSNGHKIENAKITATCKSVANMYGHFNRCSIAIANGEAAEATTRDRRVYFEQCSIKLTDGKLDSGHQYTAYTQTRVTGNIKSLSPSGTLYFGFALTASIAAPAINSVFAVRDDTNGGITSFRSDGTEPALPNLIDTSMLGDYTPTITNGIAATTAQANDLAWLQEHGFMAVSAV